MANLPVSQIFTVKVNLKPNELIQSFEDKIKSHIVSRYGDRCYNGAYIKRLSIKIVNIGIGSRVGAHLHGDMTFVVKFSADTVLPVIGQIFECTVRSINDFGIMAYSHPITVVVPKHLQKMEGSLELLGSINVGDMVHVRTLNYNVKNNMLNVVGIIMDVDKLRRNVLDLPSPVDVYMSDNITKWITNQLIEYPSKPTANPVYGRLDDLNAIKNRIDPYGIDEEKAGKPARATTWNKIKQMISNYDYLNIYGGSRGNLINYGDVIYSGNSIYKVITRAYFKLWEILVDLHVLDNAAQKPINIGNVAEGPGGFIQCLIDYRNHQHSQMWTGDKYFGITLKQNNNTVQDWSFPSADAYFKLLARNGYNIKLSYGYDNINTGNGDLTSSEIISNFAKVVGTNKCQLITGDGGIKMDEDSIESQEYANAILFLGEIITALHIQEVDGTFILKIYDIYYDLTVQLLHILYHYYSTVTIIKPRTSRPANSEKYLVCQKFKGISNEDLTYLLSVLDVWKQASTENKYINSIFNQIASIDMSSEMVRHIVDFNKYNMDLQTQKIIEGLELASTGDYTKLEVIHKYNMIKRKSGQEWCKKYHIPYNM